MRISRTYLAVALVMGCHTANLAVANESDEIETITVKARHWQEQLVQVPVSVDIYQVDERIADLSKLEQQSSNVKLEHSSVQTRVAIRGSLGYDTGLQQPVGYYIDDVALPLGGSQLPALFHVSQLEVIKGSAGDLYGRHSESGVVNIRSLSPTWQTQVSANVSYGVSKGAKGDEASSVINVSASDQLLEHVLAGSVAVRLENSTGPQHNLFDDSDQGGEVNTRSVAIGVDSHLGKNTELLWRSRFNRQDNGKGRMRYLTGVAATERFVTNYNTATEDEKDADIHSLRFDHQWRGLTLSAITGLTQYSNDFTTDLDLTPAPIPATEMALSDDMWSQEFRISSEKDTSIRWLAGVYWYQQHTDVDFSLGGSMMLPRATRVTEIEQSGYAGFGQLSWQMATALDVTFGLRAERVEKDGEQHFVGVLSSEYSANLNKTVWLPKFSVSYQLNGFGQVYSAVSKGYMPGGFNYASAQGLSSFTFEQETSTSLELGYKTSLLDNKLLLQAAYFDINTKDKQITDLAPGFVQVISNAAKTSSRGVELSVDYRWHPDWRGYVRYGTLDAQADSFIFTAFNGQGFVQRNLQGNTLPLAPETSYAVGMEFKPANGWFASVSAGGSSEYYFDSLNTLQQPSYVVVDLKLGYQFEQFTLTLDASNVTDEEIYSRSVRTPLGVVVEDTQARYVGFSLSGNW